MARSYTIDFTTELTIEVDTPTNDITDLSFKQFNNDSTWTTLTAAHTLSAGDSETFTVTEDGVYLITGYDTGDSTWYTTPMIIDYEIRVAITDEIKANLCGCPSNTCDTDICDHYDFIALTTNSNYYMGLTRYGPDTDATNDGSGVIDDATILADLLAILEHIERSVEYIDNMGD